MSTKIFSELGLSPELLKAIEKLGFEQAAPIQAAAIPLLLQGKDIVGQSQTGSGKTAAFAIPAVEQADPNIRTVQTLILCPTRELAIQVSEEVHKLALFKRGVNALPIYGGQSYERQFFGLKQGAQIVIGTPGRVMDHMRRGTLRLDTVKLVVLDEADVMLNMGFRDDIETILKSAPKERQTVFFSATMPRPIRELIEKYSRDPQNVKIEQKAMTVPTVEQIYYEVDRRFKMELLTRLIDIHDLKLGIIFCNTKRMVDDLVDHLEAAGYMADRLHGDMTQHMRDRVMNKFRKSGLEFLVATDIAARGIDVDDVQVVFNYDLPYDGEDYVHRIGRTGRAGRAGRAISFVAGRELFQIRNIERFTNTRIQRARIPTENEVEEARENAFIGKIRATLQGGEYKKQDALIERLLEEGFSSTDIASACLAQLQTGEGAAPAQRTEDYDRPERPERGNFRDGPRDGPRDRFDDRRAPRPQSRERFERPAPTERRAPLKFVPPPKYIAKPASAPKAAAPAPTPAPAPEKPSPHIVRETPATPAATTKPSSSRGTLAPSHGEAQTEKVEKKAEKKLETPPVVSPKAEKAEVKPAPAPVAEKTYTDEEILAAVKPEEQQQPKALRLKPGAPWEARKEPETKSTPKKKASRATPADKTRLWINLGEEMGIKPIDIVNAVAGETGLPGNVVGTVDVRDRHLFVDVNSDEAKGIIAKLNRAQIKGHKVKVKVA